MMLQAFVVFILVSTIDFLWTSYIKNVTNNNALKAAAFAAATTLLSSVVTISYVENKYMIIPAALGAVVGTYVSVKLNSRKTNA